MYDLLGNSNKSSSYYYDIVGGINRQDSRVSMLSNSHSGILPTSFETSRYPSHVVLPLHEREANTARPFYFAINSNRENYDSNTIVYDQILKGQDHSTSIPNLYPYVPPETVRSASPSIDSQGVCNEDYQVFYDQSARSVVAHIEDGFTRGNDRDFSNILIEAHNELDMAMDDVGIVLSESYVKTEDRASKKQILDKSELMQHKNNILELKKNFENVKIDIDAHLSRDVVRGCRQLAHKVHGKFQRYFKEQVCSIRQEKARIFNELMNIKGKIRVYIRPYKPSDQSLHDIQWHRSMDTKTSVTVYNERLSEKTTFGQFDKVYDINFPQKLFAQDISEYLQSSIDGNNIAILSYGQTGSGKTFTMCGNDVEVGLIQHSIGYIFTHVKTWENVNVGCRVVEIYNEDVNFLVDVEVDDYHVAIKSIEFALNNRRFGSNKINQKSSRSHLIVEFKIYKSGKLYSSLNFADLSGSERYRDHVLDDNKSINEMKSINKGLSSLAQVMSSLKSEASHIPFRNSALTNYLSTCLQGESKVLLMCHVNLKYNSETINTLKFGQTAGSVFLQKKATNRRRTMSMAPIKTSSFREGLR